MAQERWFLVGLATSAVAICFVFRWAHPVDVALTEIKWGMALGRGREVADDAPKLAERIKSRPSACVHYGWIFAKTGRPDAAEALFRAAQTANPSDPAGGEALAGLYFSQHRLDDVRRVFARAAVLGTPLTPEGLRMEASIEIVDGHFARAVSIYQRLARIEPPNAETFSKLGDLMAWQRKFDDAVPRYRSALELAPGDLELRIRLTRALALAALNGARSSLSRPKLVAR